MPPHPERWDGLSAQEMTTVQSIMSDAVQRGIERPARSIIDRLPRLRRDEPLEVFIRVPVILVDFADNIANRDEHPPAHYASLLFSRGEIDPGSMRDWYSENTLGEVQIVGDVIGWYRMPQSYAYYVAGDFGIGNYPRNAQRMAEDAVRAAERDIDFSRYDNDRDGVVDAFYVIHAGGGAEMEPNNRNKIWSHCWNIEQLGVFDGVRFFGYVTVPEDAAIGVCAHEAGHALFGLPDLYDTRNRSSGLGYWSTMSYGAWGDDGRRPVHFDAWSKQRLGFAEVRRLEYNDEFSLPKVYLEGTIVRLWGLVPRGGEYFLAEYRRREQFDAALPGEGLLIYHIDEAMHSNDNPWYPDNQGQLHNLVALEQADGLWELERNRNRGDAGDPYPGNTNNRTFDADSRPNSRSYTGQTSGVAVSAVEIRGDSVRVRWDVGRVRPAVIRQSISLNAQWNLVSLRVVPAETDVVELTRPLLENDNLLMVKDEIGRFYSPERDFCNIPRWESSRGYMIKLNAPAEWTLEGAEVNPQTPIQLAQGWRFTAYYPDYNLTPQEAFESIANVLTIAKDVRGQFYVPRLNYNNIPPLAPGNGYQLRLTQNVALIYPGNE